MKYEFWMSAGILRKEQMKKTFKQVEDIVKEEVKEGKLLPFARQYPNALIQLDEGRSKNDPKYKGSFLDEQSGFIVIFALHEDLTLTIVTTMSIKPQSISPD